MGLEFKLDFSKSEPRGVMFLLCTMPEVCFTQEAWAAAIWVRGAQYDLFVRRATVMTVGFIDLVSAPVQC